jgi:hypothetical protein
MHNDKGVTTIKHREYITDINMTTAYTLTSFDISPTNATLLPWLVRVAAAYQEYKILGMVFEFRSLSANAISGTSAGMGSVTAAMTYDVYQTPPISKAELSNSLFAVSCKPSESMLIPVECEPHQTIAEPLYIRHGNEGLDKHFYDFGRLDIVTLGAPNNYPSCGELWVTYDIMLLKPIATPTLNIGPATQMSGNGNACSPSSVPFTNTSLVYSSFPTSTVITLTSNSIVFSGTPLIKGLYLFSYAAGNQVDTIVPIGAPGFSSTGALTPYPGFYAGANTVRAPKDGALVSSVLTQQLFYSDGIGPSTIILTSPSQVSPTGDDARTDYSVIYIIDVSPPAPLPKIHRSEFESKEEDSDFEETDPPTPPPSRHTRSRQQPFTVRR